MYFYRIFVVSKRFLSFSHNETLDTGNNESFGSSLEILGIEPSILIIHKKSQDEFKIPTLVL